MMSSAKQQNTRMSKKRGGNRLGEFVEAPSMHRVSYIKVHMRSLLGDKPDFRWRAQRGKRQGNERKALTMRHPYSVQVTVEKGLTSALMA